MSKQPQGKKSLVAEHIDRCIDIYAPSTINNTLDEPVTRSAHEQMRTDLMLAIGMLMALDARSGIGARP